MDKSVNIFALPPTETSPIALAAGESAGRRPEQDFPALAEVLQFHAGSAIRIRATADRFSDAELPRFGLFVDGQKVAEQTVTAQRRLGQEQDFSLNTDLRSTQSLELRLLNDRFTPAKKGQPARDNNIFFADVTVDGQSLHKAPTGWLRRDGRVWATGGYTISFKLPKTFLHAGLTHDTGISATDGITRDATLQGHWAGTIKGMRLLGQMNGEAVDLTRLLKPDGRFTLTHRDLALLCPGGALTDGQHRLQLHTETVAGRRLATQTISFTLDTSAPTAPGFTLDPHDDTSPIGDLKTGKSSVRLIGKGEADTRIRLAGQEVTAGADGVFRLQGVALDPGRNALTLTAEDIAGNTATFSRIVERLRPYEQDMILRWNAAALNAIRDTGATPPLATRNLAILHLSMLQAIEATGSLENATLQDRKLAAAGAAATVLQTLFPALFGSVQAELQEALADTGGTDRRGLALGEQVAKDVLESRAHDGASAVVSYVPQAIPGTWEPTPPKFQSPLLPQWGQVKPFVLEDAEAFRTNGPYPLISGDYATDYNETKAYGAARSSVRTADQTEIAFFWADGAGTFTPPGHWNQIAEVLAAARGDDLLTTARTFALLNTALADAAIVCWNVKYYYDGWRPVTAIHAGAADGNPATAGDSDWVPLLPTPPFPEYTSGHSTFSGAASTILAAVYGEQAFSADSLGMPGVVRAFDSFAAAANEAGQSRIYGGIHFQKANQDGLACGREIAEYVLRERWVGV